MFFRQNRRVAGNADGRAWQSADGIISGPDPKVRAAARAIDRHQPSHWRIEFGRGLLRRILGWNFDALSVRWWIGFISGSGAKGTARPFRGIEIMSSLAEFQCHIRNLSASILEVGIVNDSLWHFVFVLRPGPELEQPELPFHAISN
jgi:hypothetical protein